MTARDLHLLPVQDRFLAVSPLRGVAALVNAGAAAGLRRLAGPDPGGPAHHPALAALADQLLGPEPEPPRPPRGPLDPAFLGLVTTRACNGACRYCGFGAAGGDGATMDPALAADLLEWMAGLVRDRRRDRLEVHLFGGEPTLAPELVDVVVHKTRALAAALGVRPHLEISTNGVFGPERARWIGQHFAAVVLSLDGPAAVHDRHRPLRSGEGSFAEAAATARILRDGDAALCLRCAVSAESVGGLEETGLWLAREFRPDVIDVEPVVATRATPGAGVEAPDPVAFAVAFLRLQRRLAPLGVEVVHGSTAAEAPRTTSCPVGRDAVIATPDGRLASCYLPEAHREARGQPCALGAVVDGQVRVDAARVEELRHLLAQKDRCRRCFCRWTCCGGCHVDVTPPGCDDRYDGFCRQTRLIAAGQLLAALGLQAELDRLMADPEALQRLAAGAEDWSPGGAPP